MCVYLFMQYIDGGFLKWGYPKTIDTIDFNTLSGLSLDDFGVPPFQATPRWENPWKIHENPTLIFFDGKTHGFQ